MKRERGVSDGGRVQRADEKEREGEGEGEKRVPLSERDISWRK
jgi:hypothetical protein